MNLSSLQYEWFVLNIRKLLWKKQNQITFLFMVTVDADKDAPGDVLAAILEVYSS